MRKFEQLKVEEKEEIAKELALYASRREAACASSLYAKRFIDKYNDIIDAFNNTNQL